MTDESVKQKYFRTVLEPLQMAFNEVFEKIPTPEKTQAGWFVLFVHLIVCSPKWELLKRQSLKREGGKERFES